MYKDITYIVLSPEPVNAPQDLPENIHWLNHVSIFSDHSGFYKARLDALRKVTTPWWIFVDSDDPLPIGVRIPTSQTGILIGDELQYIQKDQTEKRSRNYKLSWLNQINNILCLHRAVCNTQATKKLLAYLPTEGLYLPEPLIFIMLGHWQGIEYDASFCYKWNVYSDSLHSKPDVKQAVYNSQNWLLHNGKRVLRELIFNT